MSVFKVGVWMRQPSSMGFSLAEALVAVAILAMMGMTTVGTFSRFMDAQTRATAITDRSHEIRQGMLRMAQELSQAFLSVHKDFSDPRTQTLFLTRRIYGGTRLDFTSFSHFKYLADAKECDQNELSYYLMADPNQSDSKNLMRREQNRIDEKADEGGRSNIMIRNVQELSFSFYDPKQDKWDESWDSTLRDYKNRLPKFVRISLKAQDPIGQSQRYTVKTRLFLKDAILIPGANFAPGID